MQKAAGKKKKLDTVPFSARRPVGCYWAAALHDIRQHFACVGADKHGPIPFMHIIYWSIKRWREREGGRLFTLRGAITHDALLPALLLIICDIVNSFKLEVCSI